ncbi:GNAT family N-acetyltransferase [Bradyrhizobium sp. CB1650]|uniref:GNAT family N-acetyltransferase n=1 Tax=Bradyrhizobium sp. CB1650 TaxID=3039153 RepID=UPI002434AC84|nr:GNAT family N-acetyltransferase [Bradyrhizobium sp. CB1650]WGD55350.1 GNAT family N-acetyltransferase [Bradyrhizobium sp. CB1650]
MMGSPMPRRELLSLKVLKSVTDVDFNEFSIFQRSAFHKPRALIDASRVQTPSYYRWKYSSAGNPILVQIRINQELVASISAIPIKFFISGEALLVYQLADIATAKSYRRRGFFGTCLAALLEELGPRTPIYCFPNPNSLEGILRAGFRQSTECYFWMRPAWPHLAERNRVDAVPPKQSQQDLFQLGGLDLSDPETFEWRFKSRPGVTYSVVHLQSACTEPAKLVYRILRFGPIRVAAILAARAYNSDEWRGLQTRAVEAMSREGVHAVLEFCHLRSPLQRGFIRIPTRMLGRPFPVVERNFPGSFSQFGAADWDVP